MWATIVVASRKREESISRVSLPSCRLFSFISQRQQTITIRHRHHHRRRPLYHDVFQLQ